MRRDRDAQCVEREETWGGVSHRHPTVGLGKRRKLPHGVRGGQKIDLCISSQKEATWNTLFSIFERWRALKRRGARENSPLSTGLRMHRRW